MTSRFLSGILAFAASFAAQEVAAATPYVKSALDEIPDDIKANKPLVAFTDTANRAMAKMVADGTVVPSLTGILGAVASAALAGFSPAADAPATAQAVADKLAPPKT